MQHNHVLKKLNFDLLTTSRGGWVRGLRATFLLPCCCIGDSHFDMHNDLILKKLNFDLLTPSKGSGCLGQNICYHVAAFVIVFNLICNMTMF